MKKTIDPKKLLANIPEEDKLPKRRSELYRLYKRLVNRLHILGLDVKMTTHVVNNSNPDHDDMKELERSLLTNECACLIRTLKNYIGPQNTEE
jgi:hypothetical protein